MSIQYGASFSHRHLKYLNLDSQKAIKEFVSLKLKWIRLSCYWDEIEKKEGEFDFGNLETLIKFCNKEKINVVLSVGIKAQRYPEYYFPDWINQKKGKLGKFTKDDKYLLGKILKFIEKSVSRFKKYKCLKIWQIENEPLDPAGPNWWRIDKGFLEKEVELVRKLDSKRKILINIWGNELSIRKVYQTAIKLADIVGLDIYLRHPIPFLKFFTKYLGPFDSQEKIKSIGQEIKNTGREFWITELQTEPWENDGLVTQKENPSSFLPKEFKVNINYAKYLKPSVILLWGFEYWYWRKQKQGDNRYWDEVKKLRL